MSGSLTNLAECSVTDVEDSGASYVSAQNAFYQSPFYFYLALSPLSSGPQHPSVVYCFRLVDKNMQICIKKANEVFSFLRSHNAEQTTGFRTPKTLLKNRNYTLFKMSSFFYSCVVP